MKVSLVSFAQPILLWLFCLGNSSAASPDPVLKWLDPMVQWIRSKPNGFFSDKIVWKPLDPADPDSGHAMFAAEDIPKDETLMVIPQSVLIKGDTKGSCRTVKNLLEEHAKGEDSEWFPYIDYLFGDKNRRGSLPSAWSDNGKLFLKEVIGDSLFPPKFDIQRIENFCPTIPKIPGQPTQLEQDAYHFMISRSWGPVMIPSKSYATTLELDSTRAQRHIRLTLFSMQSLNSESTSLRHGQSP